MHYLEPKHEVLSAKEAKEVLLNEELSLDEFQFILFKDAALAKLRLQGIDTPVGAVVRVYTVRPRLNKADFADPEQRTTIRYRIIVSE